MDQWASHACERRSLCRLRSFIQFELHHATWSRICLPPGKGASEFEFKGHHDRSSHLERSSQIRFMFIIQSLVQNSHLIAVLYHHLIDLYNENPASIIAT